MNEQNSKKISFKSLFKESTAIFKTNLYEILFLTSIPFLAITLLYVYAGDGSINSILSIPAEIISTIYTLFFISFLIVFPIVMYMVQANRKGELITIKAAFALIRGKLFKLFIALFLAFAFMVLLTFLIIVLSNFTAKSSILSGIFAVGASIVCIKLLVDFLFYQQAIVLRNLSPMKALKHSAQTTKKKWWLVFNLYCLYNVCIFLIMNSISILLQYLFPVLVISSIAVAFVQSLTVMLTQIFFTLMYLELDEQ